VLYGSENRTIKGTDTRRITAAEMKYMRKTARYTWTDHTTNTDIAKELNITPGLDTIQEYTSSWLQHTNRMPCNRLSRIPKTAEQQADEIRGSHLERLLKVRDWNGATSGPAPW
jgi:hypothetical protein